MPAGPGLTVPALFLSLVSGFPAIRADDRPETGDAMVTIPPNDDRLPGGPGHTPAN